jgi:single-strand DNA-binding protein
MSVNKVILIGNLGRDPELKFTRANKPFAVFSLATSDRWKGADGTVKEKTTWHTVKVWGGTAEAIATRLHKGSRVFVDGSIEVDEVEKDGQKRTYTSIRAHQVTFLDSRVGSGNGNQAQPTGARKLDEVLDAAPPAADDDLAF